MDSAEVHTSRRIDTLREYVLVAQDKIRIEHYRRGGEQWILSEVGGPDATLHLASIDCHIHVSAIYEKIDFESVDDAAGPLLPQAAKDA